VVATEEDGKRAFGRGPIGPVLDGAGERCDDRKIAGMGMLAELRGRRRAQVAGVGDAVAELAERRSDARDPQRRRAHGTAAAARAFLQRNTDQRDGLGLVVHQDLLVCKARSSSMRALAKRWKMIRKRVRLRKVPANYDEM
jgi:hypothetical protein